MLVQQILAVLERDRDHGGIRLLTASSPTPRAPRAHFWRPDRAQGEHPPVGHDTNGNASWTAHHAAATMQACPCVNDIARSC